MTRAATRIVVLLACLCFLPSGSAVAQTERLLGAEGGNGNSGVLVTLDPATGAVATTFGPIGFPITGLAVDPADGVIYGSTGAETDPQGVLVRINRDTGAGTLIGTLAAGDPAADLTFRDGTLYGFLQNSAKDLATIDRANGVATVVGDSGLTNTNGSGLAASAGGVIYYTGSSDDTMLITIDPATGHVVDVGETLPDLDAIAFDSFQPPPPPPPPPPPADTDGDGVPDTSDACPTTFAQTPNGCPAPLPAPEVGEMVVAAVVSGQVTVRLPGRGVVPLSEVTEIPVGSVIDARRGTIRLTSARDSAGRTQSGDFSGGVFLVRQSRKRSARGLTDLVLRGGSFSRCGSAKSGKRAGASAGRTIRRLRANARGRFRTSGRNSAATVRGTRWEIIDRCDGTLTKVSRGSVVVRDFRKKKNVIVKAGKSYLARAKR